MAVISPRRAPAETTTMNTRLAATIAKNAPAAKMAHDAHRAAIIRKAEAIIAAMGRQTETPNWSDAATLEKVREDLNETMRFLGV